MKLQNYIHYINLLKSGLDVDHHTYKISSRKMGSGNDQSCCFKTFPQNFFKKKILTEVSPNFISDHKEVLQL